MTRKAPSNDLYGRFREIVSDPLNLLIERHPEAGFVDNGFVRLHNGLKVALSGADSYYGAFSSILVINRGVHEPLEEFVFQQLLKRLPAAPLMLELGAYWGHYSMWLKTVRPDANVHLVEPDATNLQAGKNNFARNGFVGTFVQAFVGRGHFEVDRYLAEQKLGHLDILHSDIQGYELEMLEGCRTTLQAGKIDHVFVSTHSQELHRRTVDALTRLSYRIEVSSDIDGGTTSYDGFVCASHPSVEPLFLGFEPLTRLQILDGRPDDLVDFVARTRKAIAG